MAITTEDGFSVVLRNGRYHLYKFNNYVANYEYERSFRAAITLRRGGVEGEMPEIEFIDAKPKAPRPKNGLVRLDSGYWKAFDKGMYLGTFQFKLTAQRELDRHRATLADDDDPASFMPQ